jgi:predicted phosphodiesterase
MRFAIYSDVHGNLHAFEAVFADIAGARFDAVYCLGDLVGYGAFPNEVTLPADAIQGDPLRGRRQTRAARAWRAN